MTLLAGSTDIALQRNLSSLLADQACHQGTMDSYLKNVEGQQCRGHGHHVEWEDWDDPPSRQTQAVLLLGCTAYMDTAPMLWLLLIVGLV